MKLRYVSFISCVYSILILSHFTFSFSKDNEKKRDNQHMHTLEESLPEIFFSPLEYTRASIGYFLEHTYNHPLYGPKFFALNLFHVGEFLKHAHKTKQPRRYISKALQRFIHKEHNLIYINSTAFFELLEQLPEFLQSYFDKSKEKKEILSDIKRCAYNFLLQEFNYLKSDPDQALDKFAQRLYECTSNRDRTKSYDISIGRLQHTVVEFLKTSCSKLIWSAVDQEWSWKLVKAFSYKFVDLYKASIITPKQFNELLWVLLYRYCYFLELEGEKLSPTFYAHIRNDLETEQAPLWATPERNQYAIKKLHYLQQALMEAEIFAQAYHSGLISKRAV